MRLPPPLIELAIEAHIRADSEKLLDALQILASEDPLFRSAFDRESGQVTLKGLNEEHLKIMIQTLLRRFEVRVHLGAPQVAYIETMTRLIEQEYTYNEQLGRDVQFARVRIVFEPNKADGERVFASTLADGTFPLEYVSGVERGIESVMRAGILAGFPVVGVRANLIDAAFRDGASSSPAFEIAARTACREALAKGGSQLLEPVMRVDVVTPQTFIGSVVGDLRSRRGQIQGEKASGKSAVVTANVPLSNMFGYRSQLRSFTRGRATFTMAFDRYEPLPPPRGGHPPPTAAAAALRA